MTEDFVNPLTEWYGSSKRDLPWRHTKDPYRIWVSEIMLQQTRVEAVIGYYERFLTELPTIRDLSRCPDEKLLKLWEGLGYYSRVRNMKIAAERIMESFGGEFPKTERDIRSLKGIGSYTAGAIGSIAFRLPVPAVDGNVLRVYARLHASAQNILEPSFKTETEAWIRGIQEKLAAGGSRIDPGDLNQALIELGAIICVPNGRPRCGDCPVFTYCRVGKDGNYEEIPVRVKKQTRRIEKKTVLVVKDGDRTAVRKRPDRGLLAGLYEFPNLAGHLTADEASKAVRDAGYEPLYVRALPKARHLFSHVEWEMTGFEVRIASETDPCSGNWIFAERGELRERFAIASAFSAYASSIELMLGKNKKKDDLQELEKRKENEDSDSSNSML